jgi:hypothetical protein
MNLLVKSSLLALALGGSAVASAASLPETFDFSYTFTDGQQITGSLVGVTSDGGQTVSDISNLQVAFNGVAFSGGAGALQLNFWNTSTEGFDDVTPVVMSASLAQNNFSISDVDAAVNTSPDYEFVVINDPALGGTSVVATNFLQSDSFSGAGGTQLDIDQGSTGTWSLTAVTAPVPEPASPFLLFSGLGAIAAFASSRKNKASA